jgi:hypothetical protein
LFKCSLVYLIQHTILSKFTVRYIVLWSTNMIVIIVGWHRHW